MSRTIDPGSATLVNAGTDPRQEYLEVRHLTVSFDGFVAVNSVDLTVTSGDLRFLIGPNGAGKTTIIDALTGLVKASGWARFAGNELIGRSVHRVARMGVGRTFQTASVIEELSVLANLDIASGAGRGPRTLLRARGPPVPDDVAEALEIIGLTELREKPAGTLAHGQKQWLEIGMLLVQKAHLLLLDEPVAGMSQAEREQTAILLRALAPRHTVVVVEHDMEFMRQVADSVSVLARGELIAEGSVADIQANPLVQEVYLGTPTTEGGR